MAEAIHDSTYHRLVDMQKLNVLAAEIPVRSTRMSAHAFTDDFDRVLSEAKQGDGRAFAVIDAALGGRILAFVASSGVDDPGAVTNEVFLGAFRSINSFSGDQPAFTGWVFRIARNKIIDQHRYRSRRPRALVPLDAVPDQSTGVSAEDAALADPELSGVFDLLDGLTAEQREIVLMRAVADLSFPQIATAVGKRTGAVKASYRRAIKTAQRLARAGAWVE